MAGLILGLVVFITGAFVLQGLRKIPANPPQYAAVTRFGNRTGKMKKEGWRFFPIYPWWYGYILVDMTKKNQNLVPSEVRTVSDMAEIAVSVSLTWRPDPDYLVEYLDSGAESGVKSILEDVVDEAVRELAANPLREPYTWEDAIRMNRKFLAEIVLTILGEDPALDENHERREDVIADLRRGNGNLKMSTLGIILNRVNITSIKAKGKLVEAAEKKAVEERERLAETVELTHVAERVKKLKKLGLSNEQALELIQTERKKVTKTINETKWNVSQETRAMIEKIGPELVARVLGRRKE